MRYLLSDMVRAGYLGREGIFSRIDMARVPTKVRTQTDEVYAQLRASILACRLMPGTKLKINELRDRLGVSLGAVREALFRLTSDGLVQSEPQKGFSVAPVSSDDLVDLTRTRVEIESLCLKGAIERGDVDWESRLVATFYKLSRIPERDPKDPARLNEEWAMTHAAFHDALVSACESTWLLRIRCNLYEQSERYRRLSGPLRQGDRDVNREHKAIMDATLARDWPRASKLMGEHLNRTTNILLDAQLLSAKDCPSRDRNRVPAVRQARAGARSADR